MTNAQIHAIARVFQQERPPFVTNRKGEVIQTPAAMWEHLRDFAKP